MPAKVSIAETPVTRARKSGAINSGARFTVSLEDDDGLSFLKPADFVTIQSPRKSDATHAGLAYLINGSELRRGFLLGGGGQVTEDGPVWSVEIVPDAAVAGSGADDVFLTFGGRDQVQANRGA